MDTIICSYREATSHALKWENMYHIIFIRITDIKQMASDQIAGSIDVLSRLAEEVHARNPSVRSYSSVYGRLLLVPASVRDALAIAAMILDDSAVGGVSVAVGITVGRVEKCQDLFKHNVASMAINRAARLAFLEGGAGRIAIGEDVVGDAIDAGPYKADSFSEPKTGKVKRTQLSFRWLNHISKELGDPPRSEGKEAMAYIVVYDIVRFSDLSQEGLVASVEALKHSVQRALEAADIQDGRRRPGIWYSPAGDGGVIVFDAKKARATWSFTKALLSQTGGQIPIRLGLATGSVVVTQKNLPVGKGILQADRLCELALEGQACVSNRFWVESLAEKDRLDWVQVPIPDDTSVLRICQREQVSGASVEATPVNEPEPISGSDSPDKGGNEKEFIVRLAELGPVLAHYAKMVGLDGSKVAENFLAWNKGQAQWPFRKFEDKDKLQSYLESRLYQGQVTSEAPFFQLQKLLNAFAVPGLSNDVPALMAEWLCSEPVDSNHVHLRFNEFSKPPSDSHGNHTQFGVRCSHKNAPRRLGGMECAFVHFELAANNNARSLPFEESQSIEQVLSNLGTPAAIRDIPRSSLHVHPGDELIFVTRGTVFIELENTGIWTPVQRGDYIHFNAEIPHAVWNLYPEKAEAIVIRFFQLRRHGTRHRQIELLQEIEDLMESFGKKYAPKPKTRLGMLDQLETDLIQWIQDSKRTYKLWTEIAPWVHDRTRRPQDRLRGIDATTKVQDLVGISRFLHTYICGLSDTELDGRPELFELRTTIRGLEDSDTPNSDQSWPSGFHKMMKYKEKLREFLDLHFPESSSEARACFEGVPESNDALPTTATLDQLANALSMPRVLLDGYLSPNALRVVAVRGAAANQETQVLDWVSPLAGAQGDASNVEYKIPSRALANSDLSVVLLNLGPGGRTAWNSHPGYETTMPINGRVRVELKESNAEPSYRLSHNPPSP